MLLSSRSLHCIGAATPCGTFKAAMSSYSFNARGRHYWRRGFCDRAPAGGYEGLSEIDAFVSGDSHVSDVRAVNYGYRQGYAGDAWNPRSAQQQQFRPWRPSPPPFRVGPPRQSADHRNWICTASQPPPDLERFKVLSYNILADYLALDHQPNLYFHIPNHILAWEWRKRRLFIEFGLWSPDIMCLQEVDRFCDLEGELAIRGYAGIWKMRTGNAVDGCAIFWRTNRFQLRHEEHIEFSKLGLRDNVAQICVLESKMQCLAENASPALPASYNQSSGANQVIVCNTHVLFNPKRGEIKLGQVRVLLDRAFAVSRAWNDAPVIVCGDFNSKPMSPLYKFIATQKLNFSGLARDQISGQHSATLHVRPNSGCGSYRPQPFSRYAGESTFGAKEGYYRTRPHNQHTIGITSPIEKSPVKLYPDVQQNTAAQMSSGATRIKLGEAEIFGHQGGEVSSTHSKIAIMPSGASVVFSEQSIINVNREAVKNREEAQKSILNEPCSEDHKDSPGSDLSDEIKLTSPSCMDNSTTSPLHTNVNFHSFQIDDNNVGNAPSFHCNRDNFSTLDPSEALSSDAIDVDKLLHVDVSDDTLSEEKPFTSCASLEVPTVEKTENSSTGSAVAEKVGSLITCHNSCKHDGLDLYNFDGSHECDRMGVLSCIEDEKIMDNMNYGGDSKQVASDKTLIEVPTLCGNLSRDAASVESSQSSDLSGLEENEESQSPELFVLEENADPNFFKELLGMEDEIQTMKDFNSPNVDLQKDYFFPLASAASNGERRFYNPYCWSPMEIEIASGKAKCTVVEHPLKLRSAYTDVEDYIGTKDSSREPQVTSYNQQFMGTVDYIWCSEDLHTVKVLDTIPKHVLQRTPGFPTQKWGSDHIALVCELSFSKSSQSK